MWQGGGGAPAAASGKGALVEAERLREFERRLLPHLNAAYGLARFLVRDDTDAEDLVQDAYLRALRYFDSYRGGDDRAWLLTIVRRGCYDLLKRRRARLGVAEFDESRHTPESGGENPEELVMTGSLRETLRTAVESLPPEFREVVVLRDVQDLSYKEIADILRIPIGTVMSRLARARRRLQSLLPLEDCGRSSA
jgi:RNA polymerase sigma-70 factor (ECF subfamily)